MTPAIGLKGNIESCLPIVTLKCITGNTHIGVDHERNNITHAHPSSLARREGPFLLFPSLLPERD
jgi:hypothetical protein